MNIGDVYNPSISGAIIFDQGMRIAPFDRVYGREAYQNLSSEPVQSGNVGAGTVLSRQQSQLKNNHPMIGVIILGLRLCENLTEKLSLYVVAQLLLMPL